MHRFWKPVIAPVITALQPKTIIEIGALHGANTQKLLFYCTAHGARLHTIDPVSNFEVKALLQEYADAFVFHQDLSLNALPHIHSMDVVLIDGDHNWYTVYHELLAIEKIHESAESFPIIFLHDVGWPYARRDLYYDPSTIPDEFRHEYAQKGMLPGKTKLDDERGLSKQLFNAVYEGGKMNGVLTAIEDFMKQSLITFNLIKIPAFFGLGILVPESREKKEPRLQAALKQILSQSTLLELMAMQEKMAIFHLIRFQELARQPLSGES